MSGIAAIVKRSSSRRNPRRSNNRNCYHRSADDRVAAEAAGRELAQAQANAEAAKQRLESGPTTEANAQGTPTGISGQQQDPDAQFWHQVRKEKWKREQEAPYASGVGFVTRPPREQRQNAESRADSIQPPASYYAPYGSTQPPRESPYLQPASIRPATPAPSTATQPGQAASTAPQQNAERPERYGFDQAEGPMHRLEEGTILPATLLNQLEGEFTGPVVCQISENVYDASGLNLLIPEDSKILGEARSVNSNNQRRLAVSFHRIRCQTDTRSASTKFPDSIRLERPRSQAR